MALRAKMDAPKGANLLYDTSNERYAFTFRDESKLKWKKRNTGGGGPRLSICWRYSRVPAFSFSISLIPTSMERRGDFVGSMP